MTAGGATPSTPVDAAAVRAALASVVDPELPVLTIEDLGILRDVAVGDDGRVEVTITPTYSGCPALDAIRADVERVLAEGGWAGARVRTVLAPAWTTDWMTEAGRRKLAEAGIAPPPPAAPGPVPVDLGPTRTPDAPAPGGDAVRCPRCGSGDTRLVSRFGSTACKALFVCRSCREPFDHFKRL